MSITRAKRLIQKLDRVFGIELEYVYFFHTALFNAGRIKSSRIETSEVEHMIQVEERWEASGDE